MAPIATYVFIDLETTGIPREENNKTKITELCMIAVQRKHVLETRPGSAPRVQGRFTHCFNPRKLIMPGCTEVTGLSNELLECVTPFDKTAFSAMEAFLNLQTKPICLLAHNGFNFDFPILRRQFDNLKVSLPEDIMCADTYTGFYDLLQKRTKDNFESKIENGTELNKSNIDSNPETNIPTQENDLTNDEVDLSSIKNTLNMQEINNKTPKSRTQNYQNNSTTKHRAVTYKNIKKVRRRFPWSVGEKPELKYKLKDIYERLLNRPGLEAHRAETDCLMTLECAVVVSAQFVEWVDDNHCRFSDVAPMTVGVRIDRS